MTKEHYQKIDDPTTSHSEYAKKFAQDNGYTTIHPYGDNRMIYLISTYLVSKDEDKEWHFLIQVWDKNNNCYIYGFPYTVILGNLETVIEQLSDF